MYSLPVFSHPKSIRSITCQFPFQIAIFLILSSPVSICFSTLLVHSMPVNIDPHIPMSIYCHFALVRSGLFFGSMYLFTNLSDHPCPVYILVCNLLCLIVVSFHSLSQLPGFFHHHFPFVPQPLGSFIVSLHLFTNVLAHLLPVCTRKKWSVL